MDLYENYGVEEKNPANFILLNVTGFYQVLNEKKEMLYNFSKGKLVTKTKPAEKEVLLKKYLQVG